VEIRIRFMGGPLHGQIAKTDSLDQVKVFFNTQERTVLAYTRENETGYLFNKPMSDGLTDKYDEAFQRWGGNGPTLRFVHPDDLTPQPEAEEGKGEFLPPGEGFTAPSEGFTPPEEWDGERDS
jgi:hypothetical protein